MKLSPFSILYTKLPLTFLEVFIFKAQIVSVFFVEICQLLFDFPPKI